MPIKRVSPGETSIFATTFTETKEAPRNYRAITALTAVGGGLALSYLLSVNGAGTAHADNDVIFGGRGSGRSSHEYAQFLIDTNQINPAKDNIFAVEYPEGIAPLDEVTMRYSVDMAVHNGQDVLDSQVDPNQPTNVYGYSQGSAAGIELTNNNPGDVSHLTIDKSPYGPGGLSHSPMETDPRVQSFGQQFGIILSEPLPTNILVTVNSEQDDLWSGGANKDMGQLVNSAVQTFMGDAHAPSDPAQPHAVEHDGNVTVNWYGDQGAPAPDAPVVDAAPAPVPAEQVAPPRSDTPEFVGEDKCIAEDGTEYYTPGTDPC